MSVDHVHKWTLVYVLEEALRQEGLVVPGTKVKKNYDGTEPDKLHTIRF